MIQVSPCGGFLRSRRTAAWDQVDHRRAGAQLHELGLFEPTLDVTAQDFAVELDRAIEIGHPQHEMVEASDVDSPGLRNLCPLEIGYVRHCRLLLPTIDNLTAI